MRTKGTSKRFIKDKNGFILKVRCSYCGEYKDVKEFGRHKTGDMDEQEFRGYCVPCLRKYSNVKRNADYEESMKYIKQIKSEMKQIADEAYVYCLIDPRKREARI